MTLRSASKARVAGFPGFLAAKRQTDRLARLRAAAGLVEVSDPRAAAEGSPHSAVCHANAAERGKPPLRRSPGARD